MRTKKVKISEEEREFQIGLDNVVRAYEKRIHEMVAVRNSLRKLRKCQYCGGLYYANGLCVNCYNLMRNVNGDVKEFEKKRKRYGYRIRKFPNWIGKLFTDMTGEPYDGVDASKLKEWYDGFISGMNEEDKKLIELHYKEGWSMRGCAEILEKDKGWICSRINSIRSAGRKTLKKSNECS